MPAQGHMAPENSAQQTEEHSPLSQFSSILQQQASGGQNPDEAQAPMLNETQEYQEGIHPIHLQLGT